MGPDGKLVVSSKDAQALDLFEELASRVGHAAQGVQGIPSAQRLGLQRIAHPGGFLQGGADRRTSSPARLYTGEYGLEDSDLQGSGDEGQGLSKRRKLKFLSDSDANIILVTGATASQLRTIDELIKLYDQKPPPDSELSRQTDIFYLRHSKAKAVRDTIKEVFRDLLSENDKALANQSTTRRKATGISPCGFDESGRG